MRAPADATVDRLDVSAYTVPTDGLESDGTLEWDSTTCVVVEASGAGRTGLGYTYGPTAVADVIRGTLAEPVVGGDLMAVQEAWWEMAGALRNAGRPGVGQMAMAAVDSALWDLKARVLELPLFRLLGPVRDAVPVYGSGGFTSSTEAEVCDQLAGWVAEGMRWVKMKVGRDPDRDVARVAAARGAIGDEAGLFVDANGAYSRKQALAMAEGFAEHRVGWYEEPVSSDDLEGLRLVRDRAPVGMEVAAGEYGYDPWYFRRMLEAGAVDVLQADVTRCGGVTGFLRVAALCEAFLVPLSAHTAPSLHAHVCAAAEPIRHVEHFHDHARLEPMLFEGAARAEKGFLRPDPDRPGMGLELKRADADRFAA